jgi:DNA-binding CsgD family transcriptional regulator
MVEILSHAVDLSVAAELPDSKSATARESAMPRYEIKEFSWLARDYGLTKREIEVAVHISHGRTSRQISHDLDISYATVLVHRANMRRKLEITNMAGLFAILANRPDDAGG